MVVFWELGSFCKKSFRETRRFPEKSDAIAAFSKKSIIVIFSCFLRFLPFFGVDLSDHLFSLQFGDGFEQAALYAAFLHHEIIEDL